MRAFKRNRENELEAELRRSRPEPRPEFVAMLDSRIRRDRRRRVARPAFRVAFAGALSAVMLVALAAVGGLGYAANAVHTAATAVTRVVKPQKPKVVNVSAASDQYGKKVTICHRPGKRGQKTLVVSRSAVAAHRAHGDIIGVSCAKAKQKHLGVFKHRRNKPHKKPHKKG